MAITATVYGNAALELALGRINFNTGTTRVMLLANTYVPNKDTHRYRSDLSGEIAGALNAPVLNTPTTATTGGSLAAATYFYVITATNSKGETLKSNEVSITTTGTTSTVSLSWNDIAGATGHKIYRSTSTGTQTLLATVGDVVAYTDTGSATPGTATPPTTNGTVTGYTAGGAQITSVTSTYDAVNDRAQIDGADVVWVGLSATFRYAVMYMDTGDPLTSPLLEYIDFGADTTVNGDTTLQWAASGFMHLVAA